MKMPRGSAIRKAYAARKLRKELPPSPKSATRISGARESSQEDDIHQQEQWQQNRTGPQDITEKTRHLDAGAPGNRIDHEVWRIADIGQRSHEHRAQRNRRQCRCQRTGKTRSIAASKVEECEVSRRVVEHARQQPTRPKIGAVV